MDAALQNKIQSELRAEIENEEITDPTEKELVQQNQAYIVRVQGIDSQIQQLGRQIDNLKEQRLKMLGISEFLWGKTVETRYRNKYAPQPQEVKPDGNDKSSAPPPKEPEGEACTANSGQKDTDGTEKVS